jgi:putative methyltransferase (TIGR04325 family)
MRDPRESGLFAADSLARALAARVLRRLESSGSFVLGNRNPLRGPFSDWNQAVRNGTGYDQPIILGRLIAAAEQATSSNGKSFDRDGFVFDRPITPFPLLTYMLMIAGESSSFRVADFGGGFGSTYRQCRPFLRKFPQLRWDIVEQPQIVAAGRERFQSEELRFQENLADAAADAAPDIVIFSSVLQYLDDPYAILDQARRLAPRAILVDRTPFSDVSGDHYAVQVVDETIFPGRLPFRVFGRDSLESALEAEYCRIGKFDALDQKMWLGNMRVTFKGLAFEPAQADRC